MKTKLYKTAKALVSCYGVKVGEFVKIRHYWTDENGTDWFLLLANESGPLRHIPAYPLHHLTDFCL